MTRISLPRRHAIQRILGGIVAAVLPRIAAASAASVSCAAAVHAAEREIPSWPRGFSGVGLRQQTQLRLRAAAQAAVSGDERLCWQQLALSGYRPEPSP